ncbi:hypothetical protein VU00_10023 [Candidatus Electrothrix marina]|uniref:DUF2065 domain-containing protein n=1 Tax=Candidatus Electrothrix marina TaxID=1859130 RepID=A0A3S3RXC9_9BACT|nr:hypothetical protein VU00_10023 [Candidatus Electrothrix marina]
MKTFITLIGLVLIFEGLPYVVSPEAMQHWLKQLISMPPNSLRSTGVVAMAIGFFLCYIGQRSGLLG